jgi:hypothetical protein
MSVDKKISYEDQRLTEKQKKKIKPANQGGGPNYLGKQETVTVPKKWLSDPDHVVAELAYITPQEQKILLDANLYGSLKGKPNRGPGGIMSLQGDLGGYSAGTGGTSSGKGAGNSGAGKGGKSTEDYKQSDYYKMMTGTGTTATSPTGDTYRSNKVAQGAVPEYVNTPQGTQYVGSQFKSYGQPSFFGDLFSAGASGYRGTYGTRPNFFQRTLGFGNQMGSINTRINPNTGQLEYFSEDSRVGNLKPGLLESLSNFGITGILKNLFKKPSMYEDMSQYNKLQLIDGQVIDPTGLELDKGEFGFPVETGTEKTQMVPMKKPITDIEPNKTYTIDELIPYEETIPTKDYIPPYMAKVTQKDIDASKMRGFNMMDRQTAIDLGMISPNVTEYEFEQLKQGNITEPGTYTI